MKTQQVRNAVASDGCLRSLSSAFSFGQQWAHRRLLAFSSTRRDSSVGPPLLPCPRRRRAVLFSVIDLVAELADAGVALRWKLSSTAPVRRHGGESAGPTVFGTTGTAYLEKQSRVQVRVLSRSTRFSTERKHET